MFFKFPSTKKNLNVNRDYLKNEIFKSLKSAKRNETNNNKQSKKQLYGNSLIQTRNFQKGKNDVYLNSTTNPNVDNLSKQSGVTSTTNRYNSLMLNLFNTRNDSKEKNWVNKKIENSKVEQQKPVCNIYKAHAYMPEIIGIVSKKLKENNMHDKSKEMIEKVALSYSYDEAFEHIKEFVELIEERENEEEFE